ncbi:MAG TPA: EcsC family protein [Rhodanobacteraceae bacterium]
MNAATTTAISVPADTSGIARIILNFLGEIPRSAEPPSVSPRVRAEAIAAAARRRAFLASASLSLPPGPLGWMTVLPELVAIWKIQAKMVADIAAAYGQSSTITREQMLYCLFKHTAAQAVRDLVVRAGERFIVRHATAQALRAVAERIGMRLSQRALGTALSRLLPLVGAAGVGTYAWFDTRQVARTALAMFSHEVEFVEETASRSIEIPAKRIRLDQLAREAGL